MSDLWSDLTIYVRSMVLSMVQWRNHRPTRCVRCVRTPCENVNFEVYESLKFTFYLKTCVPIMLIYLESLKHTQRRIDDQYCCLTCLYTCSFHVYICGWGLDGDCPVTTTESAEDYYMYLRMLYIAYLYCSRAWTAFVHFFV